MFIRASELDVIGDWLLKKCIPLHYLHLSACEDHYRIEGDEIRAIDSILLNLVISMPSLQLITAHLTWNMSETLDSTKDLEAMLPQTFGTGKLKYGEMLKWWDLKSRFSDL
ncbi:hypothetical protein BDP27DRAFT_1313111 [Rhodocollybia butyracea]|uniref:Uncharacterized protein n=1 Tax=Rhodocollybia butyracea TaxID=206335 RepID=A0A9P5QA22_9AGAR|nr:hypothetical protein BDP27DRAFT_1313111 [Rhodocollybia butyracea]